MHCRYLFSFVICCVVMDGKREYIFIAFFSVNNELKIPQRANTTLAIAYDIP